MDRTNTLARLNAQLDTDEAELLRVVLTDLAEQAAYALGDALVGVYLKGSFALGAGDVHADVDFLAVTHTPLSEEQEGRVRELHRRLPDRQEHWAHNIEGSYAPLGELRARAQGERLWLYVDNGARQMEYSAHDNTENFRWVLKHHGIAVSGPPAGTLIDDVPTDALRAEAARLAVSRGEQALADPEYLANGWGQPHEVLAHCRMLYTASTGRVVGKCDTARWCIRELPPAWSELLQAAVDARPNPWQRVHAEADPRLTRLTRRFIAAMTPRIVAAASGPLRDG